MVVGLAGLGTIGWALILRRWTDAVMPFRDAFIASFSVAAQILQARKNVENWWLWLVVNGVAIVSYLRADLAFTAFLYAIYLAMLNKKMTKASIVRVPIFGYKQAFELIKSGEADAFADLRDALLSYQAELPGSRIVPGNYGSNALAIGYTKERPLTAAVVKEFTAAAIVSGFVTRAIDKAGVKGAVAPGS